VTALPVDGGGGMLDELAKVQAFLRRDFLSALSYRVAFVTEWAGLLLQAMTFYFVGKLVDPSHLPSFGGSRVSYMEFVAVGIAMSGFIHLALTRVAAGMRSEQLAGTLESLFMTPTASTTIQLGTIAYDLIYIPIRTLLFLGLISVGFGLHFHVAGVLPAVIVLVCFIPFAWGLGVASAATTLTFRRGGGIAGFVSAVLLLGSGAYFPLAVLPAWAQTLAKGNPMAVAVRGMREALLAGADWALVGRAVLLLVPMSLLAALGGALLFKVAVNRERARGSLGLY
jgi:ABC-2 type transport system permease protein